MCSAIGWPSPAGAGRGAQGRRDLCTRETGEHHPAAGALDSYPSCASRMAYAACDVISTTDDIFLLVAGALAGLVGPRVALLRSSRTLRLFWLASRPGPGRWPTS